MLQISIIHITKNGKIDYVYEYDDKIDKALQDIDIIKDKDNYRVSLYDDKECTEIEATYYSLEWFKYLYGGRYGKKIRQTKKKTKF